MIVGLRHGDVGGVVAELSGAVSALRGDLRDDRHALETRINHSANNLREGVSHALESLAQTVATATDPAAQATARALAQLQEVLSDGARERQRESRMTLDLLTRLAGEQSSASSSPLRTGGPTR